MSRIESYTGMNLREALDDARRLGCLVEPVNGTGELDVSHPAWPHHVRLNGRKKSAPRILVVRLRRLVRPAARRPSPPAAGVPVIRVRPFGDTHAYVVMRALDYWTGTGWDPDPRQALVTWARQDARAMARRRR
jgi:hypothetical protein